MQDSTHAVMLAVGMCLASVLACLLCFRPPVKPPLLMGFRLLSTAGHDGQTVAALCAQQTPCSNNRTIVHSTRMLVVVCSFVGPVTALRGLYSHFVC
jgi:hypothetical protein